MSTERAHLDRIEDNERDRLDAIKDERILPADELAKMTDDQFLLYMIEYAERHDIGPGALWFILVQKNAQRNQHMRFVKTIRMMCKSWE